jgi:DMSO/TMAO reductase YedYZ molybdopterin-dependent catalytic subunit
MNVPPDVWISDRTVSRRTVLEWLGTGTVLTLGGDLTAACAAMAREAKAAETAGAFQFQPGTGAGAIFEKWGVRTVDPQDLTALLGSWRLEVGGLVEAPAEFSFADVVGLPRTDQATDFHCVEGWSVHDVPWNGVRLAEIVDRVKPLPEAAYVNFRTVTDKYNESLPLAVAREPRTVVAYGVGGATLPIAHGFPLRLVIPRLLGYKNAKYVYRIEFAETPLQGFWVAAGYPYGGEVPQQRLREGKY